MQYTHHLKKKKKSNNKSKINKTKTRRRNNQSQNPKSPNSSHKTFSATRSPNIASYIKGISYDSETNLWEN